MPPTLAGNFEVDPARVNPFVCRGIQQSSPPLTASIHLASMANADDENHERSVFDGVEDAVIADADSEN